MDGSAFLWYIEVKDTAKKRRKWNMDQKEIEALIAAGGAHHANCDVEQCPVCGGQLIGCNCESEYTNDSPTEAQ